MEEFGDLCQFFDFDAFSSKPNDGAMTHCRPQTLCSAFDETSRIGWPPPTDALLNTFPAYQNEVQPVIHEHDKYQTALPLEQGDSFDCSMAFPEETIYSSRNDEIVPKFSSDGQEDQIDFASKPLQETLSSASEASASKPNKRLRAGTIQDSMEAERASSKLSPVSSISNLSDFDQRNVHHRTKTERYQTQEVQWYSRNLFAEFSGDKVSCWLSVLKLPGNPEPSNGAYIDRTDNLAIEEIEHQILRNIQIGKADHQLDKFLTRPGTPCSSELANDVLASAVYTRKRSWSAARPFRKPSSNLGSDQISLCSSGSRQLPMSLCSSISSSASMTSMTSWRCRPRKGRGRAEKCHDSTGSAANNSANALSYSDYDSSTPATENLGASRFSTGQSGPIVSNEGECYQFGSVPIVGDEVESLLLEPEVFREEPQLNRSRAATFVGLYQCTQCISTKLYRTAYTWQRHETTVHFPTKFWICAPQSSWMCDSQPPFPTQSCKDCTSKENLNLCKHRFDSCWDRPVEDRSFDRLDSMRQHLQVYHRLNALDAKHLSSRLETHISEKVAASYDLKCYFCGYYCTNLNDRFRHIEKHFSRDRLKMNNWLCLREHENHDAFLDRTTSHTYDMTPVELSGYLKKVKDTGMLLSIPPELARSYIRKLIKLGSFTASITRKGMGWFEVEMIEPDVSEEAKSFTSLDSNALAQMGPVISEKVRPVLLGFMRSSFHEMMNLLGIEEKTTQSLEKARSATIDNVKLELHETLESLKIRNVFAFSASKLIVAADMG